MGNHLRIQNHIVKCLLMLALSISCSLFFFPSQTFGRTYTKEQPLIYEDAWDLWPYVFLDDEGTPTGYNVELLKMIFEELKIPYVIQLKPTAQAVADLHSGKSDLMLGMVASFHDHEGMHYGKNVVQLFTHSVAHVKDATQRVQSIDDLATQEVIVHDGSFSHHLMEDRGWGENAIAYGDMDKAIQMISAEGRGQVLWNTMSLKWLIHKYHADNLLLSPVDMPSGDYRFMANDELLLELLDKTFSQLKANDRLQPLEQKWFYPEEAGEKSLPRWLWYVVAAIAFITLALIVVSIIYHIRERKATQEGRRRNSRLAHILKTCQVRIWTYDIHREHFVWYGDDAREKKTYSSAEFSQRYSPDDFAQLQKAISLVATGIEKEQRLELNTNDIVDGQQQRIAISIAVLRSEREQPAIIIGTESDITEEYEQQKQAGELMRRYKAIFNTVMVDMVYYDSQGYILNMNKRAQQTFQMNLDDVLREHVNLSDILSTDNFSISDFENTDFFYTTLFIDYATDRQLESRKRRGTLFYEFQLVPVFDTLHHLLGAYGTGREVTEVANTFHQARQYVRQLKDAMDELSNHVNNINYALQVGGVRMISYSPHTHLLTINHRMHEAQYVLTQQRCIQLTDAEHTRQVMRMFRMMDNLKHSSLDGDIRTSLRLPGGKNLWLQLHLFPVTGADGNVVQYNGICRDTTEVKHTERMLMMETEKAQEVEQLKNKFLHNMCFEIRTPLNTVVSFAEMFEKEHSPADEEVFISEIKQNSAYLLNLINDILFLSRLDAHMVEISPQPCDFAQTFTIHCHNGWRTGQKEGVNYIAENQYEQLVVNIDDTNVGRIIVQVIENAVKHTTFGSVRVRYEYIGGKLIIVVSDTGTGIAPTTLEHIFERFNTSSETKQGTGLGMPICNELVTQLGGTIDINSEVGKGTSVWITIPCEATVIEHKKELSS